MGYVEKTLIPGESVLYRTHLHWTVLGWHAVIAVAFGLGGLAVAIASLAKGQASGGPSWVGALAGGMLLLLGGLVAAVGIVRRNATEIVVTNKRVLIKRGLLRRQTVELLLSKIESVGVDESLLGRMLGFGTVIVRGTGGTPEMFPRIADPLEFRRQVQGQIDGGSVHVRMA